MSNPVHVSAGHARAARRIHLGSEPMDCKVSAEDSNGAICIFEFNGNGGGPRHSHLSQDEWIHILEGEYEFQIGDQRMRLRSGDSVFIPRNVPHVWAGVGEKPGKILNVYQPAGKIEDFFQKVSTHPDVPTREQVISRNYTDQQRSSLHRLFAEHDMDLLGPPPVPIS
jgi:quercetin dioxygenase-like cupin family protein